MNAVFAVFGGHPLAQRPARHQAYRLSELEQFTKHLGVPPDLDPKFFSVPADLVEKLIAAVPPYDGQDFAM